MKGVPEPQRSRLLIVVSAIVVASFTGAMIWTQDAATDRWLFGPREAYLLLGLGFYLLVLLAGAVAGGRRRAWLVVTDGGFAVRPAVSPGAMVAGAMFLLGLFVASVIQMWHDVVDSNSPQTMIYAASASVVTIVTAGLAALTVMAIVPAWKGFRVEFTPSAIKMNTLLLQRLIPWDALDPAWPPRPLRSREWLQLVGAQ